MPSVSCLTETAVQRRLAGAVEPDRFEAAWAAYEAARLAGLCHEGAWEVALGAASETAGETPIRPLSPNL